jgi:DNA-directed RNA polymerase subunit RPC12/RpoP
MKSAGEKPGKGIYVCMTCGEKVTLETNDQKLPVCPKCHGSMYR